MGYYTRYSGSIVSGPATEKEVAKAIAALPYFDNWSPEEDPETIDEVIAFDETKWYDYEADMRYISRLFPDTIILIHGEGEETGDLWNHYFKNGKSSYCQAIITYPEPNI